MIKVINRLMQICNEKIEGYQNAAENVQHSELAETFRSLAAQNKSFLGELLPFTQGPSSSELEEPLIDDIFNDWMDFKSDLSGDDEIGLINACEMGEKHAISAYEEALENTITDEVRDVISDHLLQMKNNLEILSDLNKDSLSSNR